MKRANYSNRDKIRDIRYPAYRQAGIRLIRNSIKGECTRD